MLLTILFTSARSRNSPSAHQQANENQMWWGHTHYKAPFGPKPKVTKFMEAGRIVTIGINKRLWEVFLDVYRV